MTVNDTDEKMIALTNAEIKQQFRDLWDAVGTHEDTAYTFDSYCKGFEHLCAGILKLKNYCSGYDEDIVAGIKEIFEKIKDKVGKV